MKEQLSTGYFFVFIPLLSLALLALTILLSPHKPYNQKDSAFECGFLSFLWMARTQFSISFFIFAMLFLAFDLEILLIVPFQVSSGLSKYGGIIVVGIIMIFTIGLIFEIGMGALKLYSRQSGHLSDNTNIEKNTPYSLDKK